LAVILDYRVTAFQKLHYLVEALEGYPVWVTVEKDGQDEVLDGVVSKNTRPGELPWRLTMFNNVGPYFDHLQMHGSNDWQTWADGNATVRGPFEKYLTQILGFPVEHFSISKEEPLVPAYA